MVRIRENMQKQLISRIADTQLLRTRLYLGTAETFVGIINVLWSKETAP